MRLGLIIIPQHLGPSEGFEERLMTSLSEVNLKVETMDKRLGVMEKSQVVLKRRAKRMKAMEKRLDGAEYCRDI
ncbi:hypothetical protein Bca52824_018412 [Brassica carinata]|uniref:Uncharacterized protein n=1 Tax=Brassica carinata TaxID=52824 RepID=A0A8X7VQ27_BRACI|nr:hypothetical protein Bca52824_018412 [Brassica carinata]